MSDDDIKSALEIAMEKIEQLGEVTEEERLKWKYAPEGEQMATRYLKENYNLLAELGKFPEEGKRFVIEGASGILARNLGLPKNDIAKKTNRQVMEGLKILKTDKVGVENVYSRIRYLFNHYDEQGEQQRRQAYEQLKAELEARIREEMQKQMGPATGSVKIDVESQPQFQQEWRRILSQLDSQYLAMLNDHKQELANIT